MDGPQSIIAVVFVALTLVGGALAVSYAGQTTAATYDATETVETGAIGDLVTLNNSGEVNYFEEDVTIKTSNNKLLAPQEDYEWYSENGTFTVLSDNADNATVTVDYSYGAPTETQIEERRVGKECRSRWSPYH